MNRVCIAEDGSTEWSIVSVSSSRACDWSVRELRRYLRHITGVELPLVTEPGGRSILVGLRQDMPQADAALLADPAEGFDGFAVTVSADRIIVGGDNERGVIYGIYELLERAGCRWYYPAMDGKDPEIVPRLDRLEVETVKMATASPIALRICNASSFFFDIQAGPMLSQLDAAMKARYNGVGWQCDHRTPVGDQYEELQANGVIDALVDRAMLLHGPAHSFPHFLPNELFEEHPDWFGMREGKRVPQVLGGAQFCWPNTEARRTFVDNAERFVLNSPAIKVFCTLGFDGGPACECAECAKHTPGDLVFLLMNELVERLAVSAPEVMVETSGGYNPVHEPPAVTTAHPDLRIIWAHWGRHHGMGFDDDRYCWKDNLETWRRAARGGLNLCMYYTDNFATPWISAPYERVVVGDRRYILANTNTPKDEGAVDGIYMLMWPKGSWWTHSFNSYMAGRCFYDPHLMPRDVLRDYAMHYFGPEAGPLLLEYYAQWADEIDLPYRVRDGSSEHDRQMLAEQRARFIDPAVAATADDAVYSHRVGKVATLHTTAEELTEAHRLHDEIERERAAGRFDACPALIEQAKSYTDTLIQHMADVAALDLGLIDRNEVPGFITLALKKWIEREEQLLSERDRSTRQR